MPTLLEVQSAMRRGLLDGRDPAAAAVLAGVLAPADRLGIHRNTSRGTLTKALRLNFPAVERIVGEDFFAAAADEFIAHNPPGTAWLDLYGERFAEFLQIFAPAASLAYLPDVARLERCVCSALHAAGARPLECARLLDIAPSAQAGLRLTPHPSVSLVSSVYPVDDIWRAVLAGDDAALAAIDLAAGAVHLLVERRADEIAVTRLEKRRWMFADALVSGHSLASSFEIAGDADAARWLAEHLTAGHFIAFALDPAPPAVSEHEP